MRFHVELSLISMLISRIYLRYRVGLVDLPLIEFSVMLTLGDHAAVHELKLQNKDYARQKSCVCARQQSKVAIEVNRVKTMKKP